MAGEAGEDAPFSLRPDTHDPPADIVSWILNRQDAHRVTQSNTPHSTEGVTSQEPFLLEPQMEQSRLTGSSWAEEAAVYSTLRKQRAELQSGREKKILLKQEM